MKQLLFLMGISMLGGLGALYQPFWGLLLYYFFAVLRPQHLWQWALPFEWRWSLFAGVLVLFSFVINGHKIMPGAVTNRIMWLSALFGILLGISALTAHNPQLSQPWVIEAAKVLVIVVVASLLIQHLWQVWMLAGMIPLALGYIAYEINHQYFFQGGRLDVFHYGYGGYDNNGAGLFLAMGLPIALGFLAMGYTWRNKWVLFAMGGSALLIMHAVMMTYSRGAMLASVVGVGWMLLWHKPRKQAAVLAAALVMVTLVFAGPEIRDRFMSTQNFQEDASAQSRLDSWAAGWKLAWVNPVTGLGVRNSAMFVHNYGGDVQGRTIHSVYLQLAADSGIPAAAVFISILGLSYLSLSRTRQHCMTFAEETRSRRTHHAEVERIIDTQHLCLGLQGAIVVFACGAVFLSVEVFELQWLVCVLAGVAPFAARDAIRYDRPFDLSRSSARAHRGHHRPSQGAFQTP